MAVTPPLAIGLVGLVALAACQSVDDPGAGAALGAPATASTDYPSLHTVPPRPQLSYTVQQRRAILDGLVADRENARYTDQVVRYRSGLSDLPPPPAPPPVVAAVEPDGATEPPADATAPGAVAAPEPAPLSTQTYRDDFDENTLSGFVDDLVRDTADEPPADQLPADGDGAPDAAEPVEPGWLDWLHGLFGQADDQAAPAGTAAAATAPSAPVDAGAPPEAEAALASLMAETVPAFQPAIATNRVGTAGDQPDTVAAAAFQHRPEPKPGAGPAAGAPRQIADDQIGPAGLSRPPVARPDPGDVGIAIGDGAVAIEVAAPVVAERPPAEGQSAGRIAFAPGSAALPAGIGRQLAQVLATARAQGDRIRIVGEAGVAALALDRARAVAIALVRLGAKAREVEMTLAPDATGDQALLLLASPAAR